MAPAAPAGAAGGGGAACCAGAGASGPSCATALVLNAAASARPAMPKRAFFRDFAVNSGIAIRCARKAPSGVAEGAYHTREMWRKPAAPPQVLGPSDHRIHPEIADG